ncbi:MAG: FecR domain-containing protein [Fibrobacter sp.]|nr:FecR domain-containing protein [Fibrobacter sp.]
MLRLILFVATLTFGADLGKATFVTGNVYQISKKRERPIRVSQKIKSGCLIKTEQESILEITYNHGTVLRIAENSLVTLDGSEVASSVKMQKGKVWANVKKMTKNNFVVNTPVATAAVRGTVFRVESGADQSSTVALYSGLVDVGPSDTTSIRKTQETTSSWGPPAQIPGPYEVSVDTWIRLKPGTQINIQSDGKYATSDVDDKEESHDAWYLFNQQRDKKIKR